MGYPFPDGVDDGFALAEALRDPTVRAELARRGYVSGAFIVSGRDVPDDTGSALFRAWRDDTVPGGWTGEPVG